MARYQKASKKVNLDASTVTFSFANGKTETVGINEPGIDGLLAQLALHGLSQKLGDSYASAQTVDEAYKEFMDTVGVLRRGEWSERREGVGPTVSMIDEAIERFITSKYPEDKWPVAREKAAQPDVRDKLKTSKEVIALVETIRQERAAKKAAAATASAEELLSV